MYSPASTALLLATAVLTSAGRAIMMINNAAFPVFRIGVHALEYRVLCAKVWSTTMKCRYPEISFDEQEITFEDQLSSSSTSWYSYGVHMYHYLAFKVWSASQPLMKKRWKLNGLTNPGLLNGVERIFLFSVYSREYILSLQSILNIYQVLLNRAHRDIHIWHSVISTDPPIRPGTDPCPEYMAVTTNTLYVLKEND